MSRFILFIDGILKASWLVGIQKSAPFSKIPYVTFSVLSMALKDMTISHGYLVWLAVAAFPISIINHYLLIKHSPSSNCSVFV